MSKQRDMAMDTIASAVVSTKASVPNDKVAAYVVLVWCDPVQRWTIAYSDGSWMYDPDTYPYWLCLSLARVAEPSLAPFVDINDDDTVDLDAREKAIEEMGDYKEGET